jgi:hypothetical protein
VGRRRRRWRRTSAGRALTPEEEDTVAYELRGQFLEACDCAVMCPCWFDEDPNANECTGIVAWHVDEGEINGVDVSGLTTVSVSYHGGNRRHAHARVALFVDDRASDEQTNALEAAFTGKLGGPLGELATLTDEVSAVERARITLAHDGRRTTLKVDNRVLADMALLVGASSRVTTVADSAMSELLGTPAEVGKARQFRLSLGLGDEFELNMAESSANRGRFVYRHGEAPARKSVRKRAPATRKRSPAGRKRSPASG